MWRRLTADLSVDLHVVAVDLPGHGGSASTPWVSMAVTADTVAHLIDRRGHGGTAHLVGLSLGGYLALDLAAARPELVPSVVVSGVNVLPFPRPRLMSAAGRMMAPFIATGPVLRANARSLRVPEEDVDGYVQASRSMSKGTFLAVGRELLTYTVPDGATASPSRVLALAGSTEQALILRSLPVIAGAFPHGRARVVPGAGHAWNGEQPDLFTATVRAHVNGDPLPIALETHPAADEQNGPTVR